MHPKIFPAACLAILLTSGCNGSSSSEADRHAVEGSNSILNPGGDFDEASSRADAIAEITEATFDEAGDSYQCTDGCEGHSAGFEWAKENAAGEPELCTGNSQSFIEGCEAFSAAVERRVQEMRDAWEAGEN